MKKLNDHAEPTKVEIKKRIIHVAKPNRYLKWLFGTEIGVFIASICPYLL